MAKKDSNLTFERIHLETIALCSGCGKPAGNNSVEAIYNGERTGQYYHDNLCGRRNFITMIDESPKEYKYPFGQDTKTSH